MKATIQNTTKVVELIPPVGGLLKARIWQGVTESGLEFHAYIVRVAIPEDADQSAFEQELQLQQTPTPAVQAIPLRMIL